MSTKILTMLLVLACCASLLFAPFEGATNIQAQTRRRARRMPPTGSRVPLETFAPNHADARLKALADAYLRGFYEFNPTQATALGWHQYDAALESRSREQVMREVRRLRAMLAELARLPEWRLSTEARYDYLVLQSHARAELLELEEIRMWQRDANVYNRLVASSIDNILKRNYAPIEQRLDAVLAREKQIARLLAEARANLLQPGELPPVETLHDERPSITRTNGQRDDSERASPVARLSLNVPPPPRIYTDMAISQVRGSISYFTSVVPQMIERAGGGRLSAARRAEFNAANDQVIAALRSFLEWLEHDLRPRSTGGFAIGAENFRRKLLYEEMIEATPAQLIRDGEKELRRIQEEMRTLAEDVSRGRGVIAALEVLGREHPTADGLVGETRAELDRIRAFVRTQGILTPPAREDLKVAEMPEFARATNYAAMDALGAFERVATEAYYYVTPPDAAWDARDKAEHLSFYNRYALPVISIHEVYPGHYYQLLAAKNSPSPVRAVLGSSSFIEGWGHYCEQMMLDQGFGGNNPKLRLAQLNFALLCLCRYLVGLKMHTAGMSYQEGVAFFMREGYQARVSAEREARRGTSDPTYLVYTLGKMEILKLREEWQRQMGTSFHLGEFHDRLLSYGSPPVKIIRMALLGESLTHRHTASPLANSSAANTPDQSSEIGFSVLATGAMSDYESGRKGELIITPSEWTRVWTVIGNARPAPDVNFHTRAVLVVYQGQKPTGGYSISIEKIRRDGTTLAVDVNERQPASEDITTQVITSPFVAVSIPRPPAGATVRLNDKQRGVEESPAHPQKVVKPRRVRRARRRRG